VREDAERVLRVAVQEGYLDGAFEPGDRFVPVRAPVQPPRREIDVPRLHRGRRTQRPSLGCFSRRISKRRAHPQGVGTDQLHLTVKFLGDTEEGLVPEIVTAIREAIGDLRPFQIRVRGTGAFPSVNR